MTHRVAQLSPGRVCVLPISLAHYGANVSHIGRLPSATAVAPFLTLSAFQTPAHRRRDSADFRYYRLGFASTGES